AGVIEVGQVPGLGGGGNGENSQAQLLVTAAQFLHREFNVPERQQGLRVEPPVAGALQIGHGVVVAGDAKVAQFDVLNLHHLVAGKSEDVRVQNLRVQAELVHVPQALLGVGRR